MTTDVNTIVAAAYTSTATDDQLQNVLTEKQVTTAAPPDESQDTVISKDEVPPARRTTTYFSLFGNQELPPGGKPFYLIKIEVTEISQLVAKSHLFVLQSSLYHGRTFPLPCE